MLTIARLRLANWKPFKGDVVIDLSPTSHAIVARQEGDEGRSNWLGKSSLVEAIDYALWGRLPKSCRTKKDWISRGEKKGEVQLVLSDGSSILRTLSQTASEKLWWNPGSKDAKPASQDDAQAAIERAVGLTKDDYLATCHFRQREMARFVTCRPEERLELVAGWIRLAPLQGAHDEASTLLRALTREREGVEQRLRTAREAMAAALARHGVADSELLGAYVASAGERVAKTKVELDAAMAEVEAFAEVLGLASSAARFEQVVAEGKRLAAEPLVEPPTPEVLRDAETDQTAAASALGVAGELVRTRLRLVSGEFDGACPLVGDPCPSRPFVEGGQGRNAALLKVAEEKKSIAAEGHAFARNRARDLGELSRTAQERARRLSDLRAEATRLKPDWRRHGSLSGQGDPEAARARLAKVDADHRGALRDAQAIQGDADLVRGREDEVARLSLELAVVEAKVRTAAAAVEVFGPNGAQRRAAEGALALVERGANESLRRAGIELGVKTSWSREGSGLADSCGACGQAFPPSARVKECERCGAPRGPKLVNKLDLELTDRSGAAEDIAGIATQMSAASWLRADRASDWGVAVLDEPFSAMDRSNRRSFSAALPKILSAGGFSQAFVISHTHDTDVFPARIEIVSAGGWSTARVAS